MSFKIISVDIAVKTEDDRYAADTANLISSQVADIESCRITSTPMTMLTNNDDAPTKKDMCNLATCRNFIEKKHPVILIVDQSDVVCSSDTRTLFVNGTAVAESNSHDYIDLDQIASSLTRATSSFGPFVVRINDKMIVHAKCASDPELSADISFEIEFAGDCEDEITEIYQKHAEGYNNDDAYNAALYALGILSD